MSWEILNLYKVIKHRIKDLWKGNMFLKEENNRSVSPKGQCTSTTLYLIIYLQKHFPVKVLAFLHSWHAFLCKRDQIEMRAMHVSEHFSFSSEIPPSFISTSAFLPGSSRSRHSSPAALTSTVNSQSLRPSGGWIRYLQILIFYCAFCNRLFLLFDGLTSKVLKQMKLASDQHQILFENTLYFLNMAYFLIETKCSKWKECRPGLDFIQWELIGSWTVGVL